jgi:hypothetical protein
MRLSEMQTALKRYGFDDNDPLTTWLNASLHEFEDSYGWPFLNIRTTVRTAERDIQFSLPSDFRKMKLIKNLRSEQKLRYYEIHRFEREVEYPEEGEPEIYTVVGETTQVWPSPTREVEYSVVYVRGVPDLSSAEDIPDIPVQYHFSVVRGAAWIGLQAENEEDRAAVAYQAWQADVARAMAFYGSQEEDEANTVEDVQGYA